MERCGCWKRGCRACAEVARRAPSPEVVPVSYEDTARETEKTPGPSMWNPAAPKLPATC